MNAGFAFAFLWLAAAADAGQAAAPAAPTSPLAQVCARANEIYGKRDWTPALVAALECETRAREASDAASLAIGRFVHGAVLYRHGSPVESLPILKDTVEIAHRAGLPAIESEAHRMIGACYSDMGDWPAAVDAATRAYDTKPVKSDRDHLNLLESRGRFGLELHDRETSLKNFDDALALARTMPDPGLTAWILSERAPAIYRLTRNVPLARVDYEEALAIARRIGDVSRQRNVLNNYGNLFREPGTWAQAEPFYKEGLELAKKEGATDAFLLKNLGIVYRETNRRDQGEKMLLEARDLADRNNIARIRWQSRMELGTFYRQSDPAKAARFFEECIDLLEAQHSNVLLENYSAGALAGAITIYDDPYDLYIDQLVRQKDTTRAFLIAERARARAFLDTLSGARQALAGAIPASYLAGERSLLDSISANQARLRAGGAAGPSMAEIERAIATDEEKLDALRVRLSIDHPDIAHARFPHLIDAATVQQKLLAPDEALIEYFVGAESSTLWVMRRDSFSALQLPARSVIDPAVRDYVAAISTPEGKYETLGRGLAEQLLPGGAKLLGNVRRLIVVPHGILNYLPFETLQLPDGQFLTEAYAVSYAPSAATLAFLRSQPKRHAGSVIAVGDPVLRAEGASAERTIRFSQLSLLKPLRFTRRELDSVAAAFPGTRLLEQQRASEPELRKAGLGDASILHFATHGLIDEELPQRSGLVLSVSPGDDGLLQMREIYSLGLKGALVTLSACNTALGKDVTGEGIIGLTRAFIHAGALSVFGSLWNVDDASTSAFMGHFYTSLSRGLPVDEAAQAARHAFLAGDPRLRHPYYWGAFIVTGRASAPVIVTTERSMTTIVAALAALLAAGVALLLGRPRWLQVPAPVSVNRG